jgi:hypothetical protein
MPKSLTLYNILSTLGDNVTPEECKIHLASWNGIEEPLDVYFAGGFEEWQGHQNKENFRRPYVVSLISMPSRNKWLFEGVHRVCGVEPFYRKRREEWAFLYTTQRCTIFDEVAGRLIVDFERPSRQSYLNAERWADALRVHELKPDRMEAVDFPGYLNVLLSKGQLNSLVLQQNESWKSALSSVSGVYVIADTTDGCLYVGSATGENGIWGRWCSYSQTGHGGNKEIRQLLRKQGMEHAENFQFAILETGDSRATDDDILARESHWKNVLLTREFGLNAN